MEERSFISKAIPDRAGSCEKEPRRAGIVEHAVCLHDDLSRGADTAQLFGSDQAV